MPKKSRTKKQATKKVKKPETKNQEAIVSKLEELFVEIFAHNDLDRKVYICGRGTNPFEAANVVYGMLDIIYGDDNEWRRDNQKRIDDYKAEWRKIREENVED
ncbi:MAG: hypothetical protein G01um101413_749 [Parcubacteria group bacterium Gr01-1014_13]|nr:MAG: hypothetical protein G01um101413_749 [Parcubacteria group bacterium Gr01-1014_13]